jgi:aldose 1-epimerase
LPTGRLLDVSGTPFDFLEPKAIGRDIGNDDEQLRRAGGYDHNFCLMGKRAAVLYSEKTGIQMSVDTDMPGMQVYTANFLGERKGKSYVWNI